MILKIYVWFPFIVLAKSVVTNNVSDIDKVTRASRADTKQVEYLLSVKKRQRETSLSQTDSSDTADETTDEQEIVEKVSLLHAHILPWLGTIVHLYKL